MTTTLFHGGRIIDQRGERSGDVLVDDDTGTIREVGPGLTGDRTFDVTGCVVAPGFVDLHVHLRQPGNEAAETVLTGSRAAARGGFTAVVAMPNTDPCMDSAAVIREVLGLASNALCLVKPSAAISVGRQGVALTPMGELVTLGVRMFTDDGSGVQDAHLMRRALEYAGSLHVDDDVPIVLSQHCEVSALTEGGVMHEGAWSTKLGLGGQPAEAEELMVMRDIALSRLTGVRVHFQHLSTAGSVAMVRAAKAGGLPVTAEATPHHFSLTDACCAGYDANFKVHPPLRTAADVAAVKVGLADGTIDAIATDHAPHTPDTKERPFDQAPPGMLGLETAFAVAFAELDLPLADIIALLSWRPAAIAGVGDRHGRPIEPGVPANFVVIDPEHEWTVSGAAMASRSRNTAFEGRQLKGRVRHTVYEGELVVIDGEVTR
ncbi:MAG: dihydroorotase [Actinomycetota bacterium]|nr:dihydroorotase [Actinomycetota bacterium]